MSHSGPYIHKVNYLNVDQILLHQITLCQYREQTVHKFSWTFHHRDRHHQCIADISVSLVWCVLRNVQTTARVRRTRSNALTQAAVSQQAGSAMETMTVETCMMNATAVSICRLYIMHANRPPSVAFAHAYFQSEYLFPASTRHLRSLRGCLWTL